jgi:hypothetical protein
MNAIYTKDGLTVHFPAEHPCQIEFLTKGLLKTAYLAIELGDHNVALNEDEKAAISETIRFVAEIIPTENDYKMMLGAKTEKLSDVIDTLKK